MNQADGTRGPTIDGGGASHRLEADYLVDVADGTVGGDRTDGTNGVVVVANAAIDVGPDGRIAAVGSIADLGPAPGPVHRIGGLIMPGLVNAHAHTPMTLVRSVGDGMVLDRWLKEGVWPREARMTPEDVWWGMVGGSMEMLEAGVTTSCEMYLFEQAVADAVDHTGGRAVVTPGVISALSPGGRVDGRVGEIVDFHRRFNDPDGRITVGFAPHSVYDLTPEQCGEIAAAAAEVGALLHIHLEETEAERLLVLDRYGRPATRLLADSGVFSAKTVAAHGVWLDQDDRRILAEAEASVAHCPISNLKLGSGLAPVEELLSSGVTVGLGTDGPASNDNLDLWEEMKLAPLLARGRTLDPEVMSASTALRLATRSAAQAIGLHDVGHLSVGAWADLIRIDLDHPAFQPGDDLIAHLVFAGSSRHVTDVWVGGRQVVKAGRISTVDRERVVAELGSRGRRLRARAGS